MVEKELKDHWECVDQNVKSMCLSEMMARDHSFGELHLGSILDIMVCASLPLCLVLV